MYVIYLESSVVAVDSLWPERSEAVRCSPNELDPASTRALYARQTYLAILRFPGFSGVFAGSSGANSSAVTYSGSISTGIPFR